jgi:hypothetical protein
MSSSSRKCPQCGLINWADAEACKRCRLDFTGGDADQEHAAEEFPPAYDEQPFQANNYQQHQQPAPQSNGLAIASLILGLVNFLTIGVMGIGAVAGLWTGIAALKRARRNPSLRGSEGFAVAGIALSGMSLLTFGFFVLIAAISVPNLLAARRAANEAGTINSIRQIAQAEATYLSTRGMKRQFGTLQQLADAGLIEKALAKGEKYGYRFELKTTGNSFELTATPLTYGRTTSPGKRSFHVSSDSGYVLHAADKKGLEADAFDPPLAQPYNSYPSSARQTYTDTDDDEREY